MKQVETIIGRVYISARRDAHIEHQVLAGGYVDKERCTRIARVLVNKELGSDFDSLVTASEEDNA